MALAFSRRPHQVTHLLSWAAGSPGGHWSRATSPASGKRCWPLLCAEPCSVLVLWVISFRSPYLCHLPCSRLSSHFSLCHSFHGPPQGLCTSVSLAWTSSLPHCSALSLHSHLCCLSPPLSGLPGPPHLKWYFCLHWLRTCDTALFPLHPHGLNHRGSRDTHCINK